MPYLLAGVDRHFARAVEPSGRGGHDLTHPVWRLLEIGHIAEYRHPFPSPASKVRNENISPKMQLGLKKDPPTTRTARTARTPIKRINIRPNDRCSTRVWRR